jgi:hypothetical protein
MCLIPISANPYVHFERHGQIRSVDHACPYLSYEGIDRFVRDLEHQLIMYLHDQPGRNA